MLDKSGKLPGPGNYESVNVTGNTQNNSEYKNASKFGFSKANDRFMGPSKNSATPGAGAYAP